MDANTSPKPDPSAPSVPSAPLTCPACDSQHTHVLKGGLNVLCHNCGHLSDTPAWYLARRVKYSVADQPPIPLKAERLALAERCFIAGAESVDESISYDYALAAWNRSNLKTDLENE